MRRLSFFGILALALAGLALGMSRAQAQSYGPDVTATGTAIDCGNSSSFVDDNAFDNNLSTSWFSSQSTTSVSGAACIGQDFNGTSYHVRRIGLKQQGAANHAIASVIIQNSSDCSSWNTVTTITGITLDDNMYWYPIPASMAARCWRLLAAGNPTSGSWGAVEIEMMELISWPTDTPGPTLTPTITLTPSVTPTPTATSTPAYLSLGILATVGYPIAIEPQGDFGQIAIAGLLMAILGTVFVIALIVVIGGRKIGLW